MHVCLMNGGVFYYKQDKLISITDIYYSTTYIFDKDGITGLWTVKYCIIK